MISFPRSKSVAIAVGSFPVRTQTFVKRHVCGLSKRGWKVNVQAGTSDPTISPDEIEEIDRLGVTRDYWGDWSDNRTKRLSETIFQALCDPSLLRYWNGRDAWTRHELFFARRALNLLDSKSNDVYHVHFGNLAAAMFHAGWRRSTVVTWHGYEATSLPSLRGTQLYREMFAGNWTHTVGSSFMRQRLVELGAQEKKIVKIPMGVNLQDFKFVDRTSHQNAPLKLLSVGSLLDVKGHEYLISAISLLKRQGIEVECQIIGEGQCREKLEVQIRDLKLQSSVKLLGAKPISTVIEHLGEADVFALTGCETSENSVEAQGVAYIEAQARGLPVIASDIGGVSESLVHNETGFLVKQRDVSGIARVLGHYAKYPSLRLTHGRSGARFVNDHFCINKMLDAFENVYDQQIATARSSL